MKGPPRFITEDHELTPQEVEDRLEAEVARCRQAMFDAEEEYREAGSALTDHILDPQPKIVKRQVEVFPDDPRYESATVGFSATYYHGNLQWIESKNQ